MDRSYASNWELVTEGNLKATKHVANVVIAHTVQELRFTPSQNDLDEYVATVREEARVWFLSDSEKEGSFLRLCAITGRSPETLRKKLKLCSSDSSE